MVRKLLVVAALALAVPVAASAQQAVVSGYGPRVGFSVDPDQFVFGGQMTVANIAPDLSFAPDVELGFGDDRTVIALNFDLHYDFTLEGSAWRPYAGAGLGINFIQIDRQPPLEDLSDTNVGGNLLAGAAVPTRSGNLFFSELKLGLGDIPSLKLLVGWNFHM